MTAAFGILALLLVVVAIILGIRKATAGRTIGPDGGDDLLTYLLLAAAVGVAIVSLINLGRAAFPTGFFIADPERRVAAALAGLVVAGPIAFVLWRRQRPRRDLFPQAGGWTLYLALIEGVFMTWFAVTLYRLLEQIFGTSTRVHLTDIVVLAGVIAFHEWAVRTTPPQSSGHELPRIIGTGIGLITLAIGATGILTYLFNRIFGYSSELVGSGDWQSPLAFTITGAVIWAFRWLRRWPGESTQARDAWTFLIAGLSLGTVIGSVGTVVARTLVYLLTDAGQTRRYFDFIPATLATLLVALGFWIHHRRRLGKERTHPVRSYEYLTAAQGLSAAVASITALIGSVFSRSVLAGSNAEVSIAAGTFLLLGLGVWWFFWQRAWRQPADIELVAPARRTYLLGLGVVMAVTSAIALITTLVGVFQLILGVGGLSSQFPTTITLTIAAGLAAWHLLTTYNKDKARFATGESIPAFDVTVVCSHPGILSTRFPEQARIRVVYRADELGIVTDEMADEIVAAVANRASYVWVDETGFRVAPAR